MDAEAAEYDAVPPALGSICDKVDFLQIEEHPKLLRLSEKHRVDWRAKSDHFRRVTRSLPRTCRARIEELSAWDE